MSDPRFYDPFPITPEDIRHKLQGKTRAERLRYYAENREEVRRALAGRVIYDKYLRGERYNIK